MRWLAKTVLGGSLVMAGLLAGCGKSPKAVTAAETPSSPSATQPTVVLAPEPEPAATPSTSEMAAATPTPSAEESPSTNTAPAPLPSCGLKATVRDHGAASGNRFTLTLKNESTKPLRLVVPGDGSEVGWRTPALTWSASTHGAPVAPSPSGGRCGMMNRIEPNEIITLAPGASREVREWIPMPPFLAGTYDLRLTYRNDPAISSKLDRGDSAEVKRLIAASSACEVTTSSVHATL
jgi:hypothetical protein